MSIHNLVALVLCLLYLTSTTSAQYSLQSLVDGTSLTITYSVETKGWIGFGLAEPTSGGMAGSDMLVAYVINGNVTIEDHHAVAEQTPIMDACQNWELVHGYENDTYTVIVARRLLNTGDPQDRPIVPGNTRIVIAWGTSDTFGYHGSNRFMNSIEFIPGFVPPPPQGMTVDVTVRNYTVPSGETYTCQFVPLPQDGSYHIIEYVPIINSEVVHHMLLHSCIPGFPLDDYVIPKPCESPQGNINCSLLFGWALGATGLIFPPEAGYPMGNLSMAAKFAILEMHYSNPRGLNVIDTSGIRIKYTAELRQHDAGTLLLGDPYVSLTGVASITIPPNTDSFEVELTCPSECTRYLPVPIHIFGDLLHMHSHGKMIWSTLHRNNSLREEGYLNRIEYWDFALQQTTLINETIFPGDRINTHCVYSNMGQSEVYFGLRSADEMCQEYIYYWPRFAEFLVCGYYAGFTVCGSSFFDNVQNPSIRDPPGGLNRTFGVACSATQPSGALPPVAPTATRPTAPIVPAAPVATNPPAATPTNTPEPDGAKILSVSLGIFGLIFLNGMLL